MALPNASAAGARNGAEFLRLIAMRLAGSSSRCSLSRTCAPARSALRSSSQPMRSRIISSACGQQVWCATGIAAPMRATCTTTSMSIAWVRCMPLRATASILDSSRSQVTLHVADTPQPNSYTHGKALSRPLRVLFLCTHNSARSQIAEALLRQMGGAQVEVWSAGSAPTEVHPEAIATFKRSGSTRAACTRSHWISSSVTRSTTSSRCATACAISVLLSRAILPRRTGASPILSWSKIQRSAPRRFAGRG